MNVDAAVLLVAGIGSRLRKYTGDRPKALVDLGGETILGRALRLLKAARVPEIVLATGYREEEIERAVAGFALPITLVRNPDYDSTQNSVSLALCSRALADKNFLKLDGDVVFQPDVLERLLGSSADLAVAVDSRRTLDAEAMKVKLADGRILEFGKHLPFESAAETIGIEKLSRNAGDRLFSAMNRAIESGERDRYYEHYYSELANDSALSVQAVEVSDLAWSEVDTLEDLERARNLVASEVRNS